MKVTLTQEQVEAIRQAIPDGYRNRKDYPPFKLAPWDDRVVFMDYIVRVLNDMVAP